MRKVESSRWEENRMWMNVSFADSSQGTLFHEFGCFSGKMTLRAVSVSEAPLHVGAFTAFCSQMGHSPKERINALVPNQRANQNMRILSRTEQTSWMVFGRHYEHPKRFIKELFQQRREYATSQSKCNNTLKLYDLVGTKFVIRKHVFFGSYMIFPDPLDYRETLPMLSSTLKLPWPPWTGFGRNPGPPHSRHHARLRLPRSGSHALNQWCQRKKTWGHKDVQRCTKMYKSTCK